MSAEGAEESEDGLLTAGVPSVITVTFENGDVAVITVKKPAEQTESEPARKAAKISLNFENLQEEDLPYIGYDDFQIPTELAIVEFVAFIAENWDDVLSQSEVYTLSLSDGTAMADFDADFFGNAAASIEGDGIAYDSGIVRLTDSFDEAKVTFAAQGASLELTLTGYTGPEKPIIPEDVEFSYRFVGAGDSANVDDILAGNEIISSYYIVLSVSDEELVTVEDDTLIAEAFFDEALLTVELSDGTEVEITLLNPAIKAGETVKTDMGSFTATEDVPAGTELSVDDNPTVTEDQLAGVLAAMNLSLNLNVNIPNASISKNALSNGTKSIQNTSKGTMRDESKGTTGDEPKGTTEDEPKDTKDGEDEKISVTSDPIFFDISLVGPNGEKIQTGATVSVETNIKLPQEERMIPRVSGMQVFHIDEKGNVEQLSGVAHTVGDGDVINSVSFDTPGFSLFAVVYTVDFVYVEKKAEIGLDFSDYELFSNKADSIVHENEKGITVIDISSFVNSASVQEEDQSLCGVVYTVSLTNATELDGFDADFFVDAAVSISGKGVEYTKGTIRLVGDVESATVIFATKKASLEMAIANYTAPEKPVVPDTEDGFAYRFFEVGQTAAFAEILDSLGIVSSYYSNVSVSDANLVTVVEDTLTVNNYFGEVVLTLSLSDGTEVQIRLQNPAPIAAGETVTGDDGSFSADAAVPTGTKLTVEATQPTEDEKAAVEAKVEEALGANAQAPVYFDISLVGPQGEKVEAGAAVTIKTNIALPQEEGKVTKVTSVKVFHVAEDGTVEPLDATYALGENGITSVSFRTDGFSVFGISYTVDFILNGIQFSMAGDSKMLLSDLAIRLGICANQQEADEFVQTVSDVTFTDGSLLRITQIMQDTVIPVYEGTGDGEDELFAIASEGEAGDLPRQNPSGYLTAKAGDWLIESLAPFTTSETMTITFLDGSQIVISVTDEAYGHEGETIETQSDGTFDLTALAHIRATAMANTTDVDWDVELPFQIRYDFMDSGIYAITDYIDKTGSLPTIVYDFSSVLNGTLDKVIPASYYLSTGYRTVGKVDITADGKATFTFTDREWLESRNSLRGTFDITLVANPDKVQDHGTDSVEFPASGDPIPVTYKRNVSNSTKNLDWPIVANPDGSYTLNYTAYVDVNGALDTLYFTDTMTGLQSLVADSVKVNGLPVTGLSDGQNPFFFEVGNVS